MEHSQNVPFIKESLGMGERYTDSSHCKRFSKRNDPFSLDVQNNRLNLKAAVHSTVDRVK